MVTPGGMQNDDGQRSNGDNISVAVVCASRQKPTSSIFELRVQVISPTAAILGISTTIDFTHSRGRNCLNFMSYKTIVREDGWLKDGTLTVEIFMRRNDPAKSRLFVPTKSNEQECARFIQ